MVHELESGPLGEEGEVLGTGINFFGRWDFKLRAGSFELGQGISILGRDIAFTINRRIDRGAPRNADEAEDIRITIRTILENEPRVSEFAVGRVSRAEGTTDTFEVELEVTAQTDEQATFVITGGEA